jgi:dehydrogenase/reductase SDR family protein 7B
MLDLRDRVVLITGASRGIGRATALEFARSGSRVALTARNADALAGVRTDIAAMGGHAIVLPADIRDAQQVRALVAETAAMWGRIDVLVNNAGVTYRRSLAEMTEDEIREILAANLLGTIWCIREALPHLIAQGDGHIVNVSSILGKRGVPGQAVYSASKFAVLGLSEALRTELASRGVTVTAFCPSSTRTAMNLSISGGDPAFQQWIRTKFMFTPEVVARRIVRATQRRQREVVLSLPAKLVVLLNKCLPRLLDVVFARVERKR